jgi:hypothetical protein
VPVELRAHAKCTKDSGFAEVSACSELVELTPEDSPYLEERKKLLEAILAEK